MALGLDWYYNSNTGALMELPPQASVLLLHSGLGWHGPFNSKQAAIDYYTRNQAKNPGWKAPSTSVQSAIGNAPDAAATIAGNVADTPFHGVNLETWFLRIGEILLGLVLIGVGLAKITGTSNVISKAMKVIP